MAAPTEVLKFEAHPTRSLHVQLFTGVANAQEIRSKVVSGELPADFAFMNAELVPSLFTLGLAAHKALTAEARRSLTTRSLHGELVFNLSGSKHIGESFKRFGLADDTQSVLAARFDATPEQVQFVAGLVKGTPAPLEQLPKLSNAALLHKYYKFTPEELQLEGGGVEGAVACRIAGRDCN